MKMKNNPLLHDSRRCNDCDARFSHRRQLSEHLNTFHKLGGTVKPDISLFSSPPPSVVAPDAAAAAAVECVLNGGDSTRYFHHVDDINDDDDDINGNNGTEESAFKIEECKPTVVDKEDDVSAGAVLFHNDDDDVDNIVDEEDDDDDDNDVIVGDNVGADVDDEDDDAGSNYSDAAPTPRRRAKSTPSKKASAAASSSSTSAADRDLSGPPSHVCFRCGLWFITSKHLELHVSFVHEEVKSYKCAHCHETFGYFHDLDKHVKILHKVFDGDSEGGGGGGGEGGPVVGATAAAAAAADESAGSTPLTPGAASSSATTALAIRAAASAVVASDLSCPYADCKRLRFKTGLHRESHLSSVHIGQRYPCPKCLVKAYRSIGGVKKHIDKCRGDSIQMKCSQCAEIVAQRDLPAHFDACHPGKEPTDSKVVLPAFFPPSFYDRFYGLHKRRVIKTTCDICGENVVGLKKHLMSVHSFNDYQAREKMENNFKQCHLCDAILAKRRFKQHLMRKHPRTMPGKTYLCEICAKSFHSYTAMYSHKRSIHYKIKVRAICICMSICLPFDESE